MKICIVTHKYLLTDGQGRVNYEIVRYLSENGHEVSIVSSEADSKLTSMAGVTWFQVKIPRWIKSNLLRYQYFAFAARAEILRNGPFDIVHLNGGSVYFPADVNACHFVHSNWIKSKYHVSRQTTGLYSLYQRIVTDVNARWEKIAYRDARNVVAVSDFVKDSLITDALTPADKISVIVNGVDTAEFRPLSPGEPNLLREITNTPSGAFVLFFSGGIATNRKNLDIALHAVAKLGCKFHLVVAGNKDGSPYPDLAKRLNIANRVHFLGHRTDVRDLLRGADVFAFASHYDPCPLSVFEAMASGVPIITAPTVGNSVLLTDGVDGFVLNHSNDLDQLVSLITKLESDSSLRSTISNNSRNTALRYSWTRMAEQYLELYKVVINSKRQESTQ